jgi:hypothetical protein
MADAVMPAAASTVLAGSTVPLVVDSTVVVVDSMAEEAVASTEEAVVMAAEAVDTGNPGSVNQLERLASEMLPAVSLCGASPFLAKISVFTGIDVVKYQDAV